MLQKNEAGWMYADWQAAARHYIAKVDANLPKDATLKERRAALRKVAWEYHGGTSWGKKTWSKHTSAYLAKHGQPPRKVRMAQVRGAECSPKFGPDIIFPFRAAQ